AQVAASLMESPSISDISGIVACSSSSGQGVIARTVDSPREETMVRWAGGVSAPRRRRRGGRLPGGGVVATGAGPVGELAQLRVRGRVARFRGGCRRRVVAVDPRRRAAGSCRR